MVGEPPLLHGVEQRFQGLSDGLAAAAERQQILPVDRQLPQRKAGVFFPGCRQVGDHRLVVGLRLFRGGLPQRIRPAQRQKLQKAPFPPAARPAHRHCLGGLEADIVDADQLGHVIHQPGLAPQPPQQLFRDAGPGRLVPVKVPDPFFIHGAALRLGYIVQQRRPAQRPLRRDILQHRQRVLPYIAVVVGVALGKAHHRQQLRQHHADCPDIFPQHRRGVFSAEQLFQLLPHPLRRDAPQHGSAVPQRRRRRRFDRQAQRRRKAQPPQNAQAVFGKAAFRIPHRPQQAGLPVLLAAVGIDEAVILHIPRHGPDGKIPPGQILPQAHAELHAVRPPSVGIAALSPEAGDLHRVFPRQHRYRAVPQPRFDHPAVGKQGFHLLRQRRNGNIPIVRRHAAPDIPHTAAHRVGLKARPVQPPQQRQHRRRDLFPHTCRPLPFFLLYQISPPFKSRGAHLFSLVL